MLDPLDNIGRGGAEHLSDFGAFEVVARRPPDFPVTIEQLFLVELGHGFQCADVAGVVFHHGRVVRQLCADERHGFYFLHFLWAV